jgi:hypothetical protein
MELFRRNLAHRVVRAAAMTATTGNRGSRRQQPNQGETPPTPTAKQSLPRERWLLAWFVGCALLGGAVGAVTAYVTYTPSDAPLDFGRAAYTEIAGVLGLLIGLAVGFVVCLVFIAYRMFGDSHS